MAKDSITGMVTDDTGSPLPGASVVVKGTTMVMIVHGLKCGFCRDRISHINKIIYTFIKRGRAYHILPPSFIISILSVKCFLLLKKLLLYN
jgi:hypothetical protein